MRQTGTARRRALAAVLAACTALLALSSAGSTALSGPEAGGGPGAGSGIGTRPVPAAGPGPGADQVVTWGASPDVVPGTLDDRTVRNLVHTSIGGPDVRVELSNVFGTAPVAFDAVHLGLHDTGAAVVPGTNRQVTFGGAAAVTVPPGAQVLSDPVGWAVPADTTLAVSVHAVGEHAAPTGHQLAMQTSHVSAPGDHAAEEGAAVYPTPTRHWYWVTGLVVDAPERAGTVALLGDSITDGYGSTVGADRRWPDRLADRLAASPGSPRFGVMNQGISGNRVLADGFGPSARARFDRDVLARPGVETVVLLEGINDIGNGDARTADALVSAYRQLVARAHAADVCVVGATLPPFEGARYHDEAGEEARAAVNRWIRTGGGFDAVLDVDAALRDPAAPRRLLPAYDSGDHLHPNDAGYAAIADAVDLRSLDCDR